MMELYLSILALLVSLVSLWLSIDRNSIARRALELSENEAQKRESNFSLYLIDSFRYIDKNKNAYLVFNVTITNKSNNSNTFKVSLEMEYIRDDDSVAKVLLSHSPMIADEIKTGSITAFDENIAIKERGIESKWLLFKLPTNFNKENRISLYSLAVIDVQKEKQNLNVFLLKEVVYAVE